MYNTDFLYDTTKEYPANYFRMNLMLNVFINNSIKRVIEVGVGSGVPLLTLAKSGMDVSGFDISKSMVEAAKATFANNNVDSGKIFYADIQDPSTYIHVLNEGLFDGLLAMGIMPHVKNDTAVLKNMHAMMRPDGTVFIEFRNKLFSLFTFNRYTKDFILNDLLDEVSDEIKEIVSKDLDKRLDLHLPAVRDVQADGSADYDAILSKFHNPFDMEELFTKCGFYDIKLHWYHYHAAMPKYETENPEIFRNESISLEYNKDSWKGMFLCSAYVVEAKAKKGNG